MSERLNIALIGAGHLGGSFALALREAGADVAITAYDLDAAQAELLQLRGAVDAIAASVEQAVRNADLVMLATPLRTYPALAQAMAPDLPAHAVVTDLGSVKRSMEALAAWLPAGRLVPGHPIAGGEQTGAAVARGDLFRGKLCILTPDESVNVQAIESVETLWHLTGADVLRMPTPVHDTVYAHVSHVPHVVAFVAAEFFYRLGVRVDAADDTLQRFLRISRSDARMWSDIVLENREAVLSALSTYGAVLEHFARELRSNPSHGEGDEAHLAPQFLPRILASSLISSVSLYEQQSGMQLRPFGAGGMRDIVAPAAIDPETEFEKISHHAAVIALLLEKVIPLFRHVEQLIGAEDEDALFAEFSAMTEHARSLISARQ